MLVKTRTESLAALAGGKFLGASFATAFFAASFGATFLGPSLAAPFLAMSLAVAFGRLLGPLFAAPLAALVAPECVAAFAADVAAGFLPRAASYTSYCRYKCWSCVNTCVMFGTSS